jgi:hypothetical protein
MRYLIIVLLFAFSACRQNAPDIKPASLLTAHIWKSTNYIIKGIKYQDLEIKVTYYEPTVKYNVKIFPGDSIKYSVTYELLFTDDNIFKETQQYRISYKCSNCNEYVFIDNSSKEYQDIFEVRDGYMFLSTHEILKEDTTSRQSHRYFFINHEKVEILKWERIINTSQDGFEISVNDNYVPENSVIQVDMDFSSIL